MSKVSMRLKLIKFQMLSGRSKIMDSCQVTKLPSKEKMQSKSQQDHLFLINYLEEAYKLCLSLKLLDSLELERLSWLILYVLLLNCLNSKEEETEKLFILTLKELSDLKESSKLLKGINLILNSVLKTSNTLEDIPLNILFLS